MQISLFLNKNQDFETYYRNFLNPDFFLNHLVGSFEIKMNTT